MSLFKKHEEKKINVDRLIEQLETEALGLDGHSPEYAKVVEQLDKLYKIRTYDKPDKFTKDATLATSLAVAGNLAGILLILGFEKVDVITSKALGFIIKPRV